MEIIDQNGEIRTGNEADVLTQGAEIQAPADAETERLRQELASVRDQHLRLAAEFDNYRRRVRGEQAEAADRGKRDLLEQIISAVDDLDLALDNLGTASDAVAEVLRLTHRRFIGVLETNGVVGIESEGEKFDPERHEAFDVIRGTESEADTVHTQMRRGYLWNGKLLRPALVIVAQ